jgi:hypothetical protein
MGPFRGHGNNCPAVWRPAFFGVSQSGSDGKQGRLWWVEGTAAVPSVRWHVRGCSPQDAQIILASPLSNLRPSVPRLNHGPAEVYSH